MEIIKKLSGHSGCEIYLVQDGKKIYVRKIGEVNRNLERLTALYHQGYPVCKIFYNGNNLIDMEYIHGSDMFTFLSFNSPKLLIDFLKKIINSFSNDKKIKNYEQIVLKTFNWVDDNKDIPFTIKELVGSANFNLYSSTYHGDLTLENIIFSNKNKEFFLIDAVTTPFDSFIFDLSKLRQDLTCKWFLRSKTAFLDVKLNLIHNALKEEFKFAFEDAYLILMLLRVYVHTNPGDNERKFIIDEINKLWL